MVITGITFSGATVVVLPAAPPAPRVVQEAPEKSSLTVGRLYQELQQQKRQIGFLLDQSELQQARMDILDAKAAERAAGRAAKKMRL